MTMRGTSCCRPEGQHIPTCCPSVATNRAPPHKHVAFVHLKASKAPFCPTRHGRHVSRQNLRPRALLAVPPQRTAVLHQHQGGEPFILQAPHQCPQCLPLGYSV
jgi:hypothetical protein